jgi:hypothetical protein
VLGAENHPVAVVRINREWRNKVLRVTTVIRDPVDFGCPVYPSVIGAQKETVRSLRARVIHSGRQLLAEPDVSAVTAGDLGPAQISGVPDRPVVLGAG